MRQKAQKVAALSAITLLLKRFSRGGLKR